MTFRSYPFDDSNAPLHSYKSRIGTFFDDGQDDRVIVLVGPTGAGKSSIIQNISGDTSAEIGYSLDSKTSRIHGTRFVDRRSGRRILVVDTPGFDDSRTEVTDAHILQEIAEFLLEHYGEKRKLNGLVYLHRICDPRFGGQSRRNLRMFKELCGSQNYKNVVVLTTFWDKVTEEEGTTREAELKAKFFKELVDGGAHFMRHWGGDMETGIDLLRHMSRLSPTNVRIQEEICEEGKSLEKTAAGSVLDTEIRLLIAKQQREAVGLRRAIKDLQADKAADREILTEELSRIEQSLKRLEDERFDLKNGLTHILEKYQARMAHLEQQFHQELQALRQEKEEWQEQLLSGREEFEALHQKLAEAIDELERYRCRHAWEAQERKEAWERQQKAMEEARGSWKQVSSDHPELDLALSIIAKLVQMGFKIFRSK